MARLYNHYKFLLVVILIESVSALNREIRNSTYDGPILWKEGGNIPTSNSDINLLLNYSSSLDQMLSEFSWPSKEDLILIVINYSGPLPCPYAYYELSPVARIEICPNLLCTDLYGHEYVHGILNSLIGQYWTRGAQQQAICESYCDIIGTTLQMVYNPGPQRGTLRTDGGCSLYGGNAFSWIMGIAGTDDTKRWLFTADAYIGPTRDLWNPTCFFAPDKVSSPNYACLSNLVRAAHINNGVPNHCFALLVDGGEFNGQNITGLGLSKTFHIFMRGMLNHLTDETRFAQLADILELSCADLNGTSVIDLQNRNLTIPVTDNDCEQVTKAVLAVELQTLPTGCGVDEVSSLTVSFVVFLTVVLTHLFVK